MSYEHEPISPMFRIDVSAESESSSPSSNDNRIVMELLRQLVAGQQQQNRLLEELVQQHTAANKQRANELPRDTEIVVHCKMGGRSAKAAAYLRQLGYERVLNLTGGIKAWAQTVDPSMPTY